MKYLRNIIEAKWWHGTPDVRGIREKGRLMTRKEQWGAKEDKPTYFLVKSKSVAKSYADPFRAFNYRDAVPAVIPVEDKFKNPKHIDWGGNKFHYKDEKGTWHHIDHHIEQARDEGHDSVIIHNIIDDYNVKSKKPTTIGVSFNHENLKL